MKKQQKNVPDDRFDISIHIIIERFGTLISLIIPHGIHRSMHDTLTPQEETNLAHHIASALHDTDAMRLHQKLVRKHPKSVLLEVLDYVLNKPRKDITSSRAAYYNYLIGLYEKTGKYPRT
jgi:hypothetical protein